DPNVQKPKPESPHAFSRYITSLESHAFPFAGGAAINWISFSVIGLISYIGMLPSDSFVTFSPSIFTHITHKRSTTSDQFGSFSYTPAANASITVGMRMLANRPSGVTISTSDSVIRPP